MKIKIAFLACVLCFVATINSASQYRINKNNYDYRSYEKEPGDPYNPIAAGVASLYVTGLGQIISGEVNRGLYFLAGSAGSMLICGLGYIYFENNMTGSWGIDIDDKGVKTMLLGISGVIALRIWSVVDAVRVAKVNSLAWRDSHNNTSLLMITPSIRLTPEHHVAPAITASLRF